jgi:hypothetical protein
MGKVKQTTRITYRKSNTVDKNGRKHCKTCGAFIGNRGRKK